METMELGEDVDIARFADPMQFLRYVICDSARIQYVCDESIICRRNELLSNR